MSEYTPANTRRVPLLVRVKPASLTVIDRLAEREGVSRSEMVRRLLAEAITARRAS